MTMSGYHQDLHRQHFAAAVTAYKALCTNPGDRRITIRRVAAAAAVSAQIISRAHNDDWARLKAAILGGQPLYPEFGVIDDRERIRSRARRENKALDVRVKAMETAVGTLTTSVHLELETLREEVARQLILRQHPAPTRRELRVNNEAFDAKEEVARLKARLTGIIPAPHVAPEKHLYQAIQPGEMRQSLTPDHLVRHDGADPSFLGPLLTGTPIRAVYVLCGNFASGKLTWTRNHLPDTDGMHIYVIAPHHTRASRRHVLHHVRSHIPACRIVCVRIDVSLLVCLERNGERTRQNQQRMVPGEVIRHVDLRFEEVTIDEGFDAIECVREYGVDAPAQTDVADDPSGDEWAFDSLRADE